MGRAYPRIRSVLKGARMSSLPVPLRRVGIFVGGRGSRLGGVAKGNLELDGGGRLITRLAHTVSQAVPGVEVLLVGASGAYSDLGLRVLADEPPGIGPLGGLRALLLEARAHGDDAVLALACDLPHLEAGLVARLVREAPEADFLAPRAGELWHALVARYSVRALDAVDAALAAGERALQRVIGRLGARACELAVNELERAELHDWDTPEDVERSKAYRPPGSVER